MSAARVRAANDFYTNSDADPVASAASLSHPTAEWVVGQAIGGRHIAATGVHPMLVTTSATHAVGAGDTLGEVSGVVRELFEA